MPATGRTPFNNGYDAWRFGGATVIEVRESHDVNAYRAVYTVRYADAVYLLHAFQKKIKDGHRDAKNRNRLGRKTSERSDQGKGETTMTKIPAAKDPTRNVWLQLGLPDAEEHFLKAELVLRLDKAITSLGLTQRAAARRIGTTQPELSKILGGKFTEVSLERLMRFPDGSRLSYRDQNWGRTGTSPGTSPSKTSDARLREP